MCLRHRAILSGRLAAVVCLAALLALETGFGLQCRIARHRMQELLLAGRQRHDACLALKWRWEADDQQNQYTGASSAGSATTVGPIDGYVMDVSEDEAGHAVGECHALHASYGDLLAAGD